MPRKIDWPYPLPACDFCGEPAKYDGKTIHGPWANMCDDDLKAHGFPTSDGITNERVTDATLA